MGKKAQDTYWNHIFRIDHNLSSKQRFYVRADITDLQRPENAKTKPTATLFIATTEAWVWTTCMSFRRGL